MHDVRHCGVAQTVPMVKTTTAPKNPFPARWASDRSELLSMFSLERRLQNIDTTAGAQTAQIVCGRVPQCRRSEAAAPGCSRSEARRAGKGAFGAVVVLTIGR
eukprot:5716397-Alexandrium_andersonii.AAC.1